MKDEQEQIHPLDCECENISENEPYGGTSEVYDIEIEKEL